MRIFAVAVCFLLGILAASAQTGDELSQQCHSNRAFVLGFVEGVLDKAALDSDVLFHFVFDTYDVHKSADRIEKDNQALVRSFFAIDGYCPQKETTSEQKAEVFCKYLLDNAEQRAKNAAELLGSALKASWPCK